MVGATSDATFVHYGVGGAGNVTSASRKDLHQPSQGADSSSTRRDLSGRRFSTGIGGSANITLARQLEQQHEAEETAGLLYDMQAPGIVLVDDGYYTGIGGAANAYRPTEGEVNEARQNNENMRRQSLAGIDRRRESLGANTQSGSPPTAWNARRMSVADSMKEFIKGRKPSKS